MKQHDDVVIMFIDLFTLGGGGVTLRIALLDIGLEASYLFVDIGNVLFDNEGKLLRPQLVHVQ